MSKQQVITSVPPSADPLEIFIWRWKTICEKKKIKFDIVKTVMVWQNASEQQRAKWVAVRNKLN
jgi:hypothetical protein